MRHYLLDQAQVNKKKILQSFNLGSSQDSISTLTSPLKLLITCLGQF